MQFIKRFLPGTKEDVSNIDKYLGEGEDSALIQTTAQGDTLFNSPKSFESEFTISNPEARHKKIERIILQELSSYWLRKYYKKLVLTGWIVLILYSQIAWTYSMIGCEYDIIVCIKWLRGKFIKIIFWVAIYSAIHFAILIHAFFTKNKKIKYIGYFLSLVSLGYRYLHSQGFSKLDYSQANFTLCCVMMMTFGCIFFWWFFSVRFYLMARKGRSRRLWVWSIFWASLWSYFYVSRFYLSCMNLQTSFDPSVRYSDTGKECRWARGKICWHYAVDGIFRPLFWWGRGDCRLFKTSLDYHLSK